jgi:hypothetical protein
MKALASCSPLSGSSARSRALASCQRQWEASLCLRAHDRVGVGDDIGRFLRQVVEERVGKQKTQIPENEKQIGKTNEKRRRIRCPCDWYRDLPRREGARHYLCQQLRANCRAWRFTGPSSSLREAGPSRTQKRRCLREPKDRRHLVKGCSRGEGPGADLWICVSFAR